MHKNIIIVGAGPAGIGMGIVLQKMEQDFLILEKGSIGESFRNWPSGTQFLSPSFSGNYFGSPDLNAVCPDTSPAYVLDTEHPSGKEYAIYLERLVDYYALPLLENRKVKHLSKEKNLFHIETQKSKLTADIVIWAGGEYQFPKTKICEGHDLGIHSSKVQLDDFKGGHFAIIGGYESAFDIAIQLAKLKRKSIIFDSEDHLSVGRSDSSFSISPFTKDRFRNYEEFITIKPYTRIQKIHKNDEAKYVLTSHDNDKFIFANQPILATGFETSLIQVKNFFDWEDGSPILSDQDESTKVKGFFLTGPQVKHRNVIFCFIYKFRQRFAIIAEAIAEKLDISTDSTVEKVIANYQQKNFYLRDLSCCDNECVC